MCGRYSLTTDLDALLPRLRGPLPPAFARHYAPRPLIAPGEPLLIQCRDEGRERVALALWGLLPAWQRRPEGAARPINARSETVAEKPSFRGPWRHRRCLIPADAFFEKGWRIARQDGAPFWLAGLWERWLGDDGSELDTCCVLTTRANGLIAPLHPRMPVLIPETAVPAWLAAADGLALRRLQPLLQPWSPAGWRLDPLATGPRPARRAASLDRQQLSLPL
jgi:putative SOS response-associated peptidase YedK